MNKEKLKLQLKENSFDKNGGEISLLGYFLDFYDKVNNIIIEWNERRHYIQEKIIEKDKRKQRDIENFLKNINYIIIKEEDFLNMKLDEKYKFIKNK